MPPPAGLIAELAERPLIAAAPAGSGARGGAAPA